MYIATGLVQTLRARYAAFSYTDGILILDILPVGAKTISRFVWQRDGNKKVAEDLLGMIEQAGREWYKHEQQTGSRWWASQHLLDNALRKDIPVSAIVPSSKKTPRLNYKAQNALRLLELTREQIVSEDTLRQIAGVTVPESINIERGRLLDVITDMHQYFFGRKVALAGDPDQLISLTQFLVDIDMWPIHIVTGTPGKKFEKKILEITKEVPHEVNVKSGGDMFLLHQWVRNEPVDLLLGNTYLKYIARDEDIPLVRFGFPILDRIGHSYFPTVGYRGGLRLLEKILDALLDRQDRDAAEESFELVM